VHGLVEAGQLVLVELELVSQHQHLLLVHGPVLSREAVLFGEEFYDLLVVDVG